MTMKELKKKIEAVVEEQNELYNFYLKMWDESLNREDEERYDNRMKEIVREIRTYEKVIEMMEENK